VIPRSDQRRLHAERQDSGVPRYSGNSGAPCGAAGHGVAGGLRGGHGNRSSGGSVPHHLWYQGEEDV
ncbi:unnamed protein product, partial [Gadus morhua 'NCC']